jgi:hypothetical protein
VFPSLKVIAPAGVDPLAPTTLTETLRVIDWPTINDLGVAVNTVFESRRNGGGVDVTVSIAARLTPLRLAVMEELPIATARARPVTEMVATEGVAEAQVT